MTNFVFGIAIIFALNFVPSLCEGKIKPPPDGNMLTFVPGSTGKIRWSFDDGLLSIVDLVRSWTFTSSDGSIELLARIYDNDKPQILTRIFPGVAIEKPATVVLKNVNGSYNGTYQLALLAPDLSTSEVVVFIAVTPIVTVDYSSPIALNRGDNFTCVCKGQDGNPPADVTWFKGNVQIGDTGKEEQILSLSNVDKDANGTYRCVAKSHEQAKNETSIELIVNYSPEEPYFKEKAVVGESFTIVCESDGRPKPSHTIIHNDTNVVSTNKTYTIDVLQYSHTGFYKCIAENKLGSSSNIYHLSVIDQLVIPTTGTTTLNLPTTDNSGKVNTAANKEDDGTIVVAWHIVLTLVSGIIIGVLLSLIVSCSRRRWFRNRKPERNHHQPQTTEVDTTYQELDLTKINREDNYQSLRVNAASDDAGNDNESTYAELNKTRDDENNYQSLS